MKIFFIIFVANISFLSALIFFNSDHEETLLFLSYVTFIYILFILDKGKDHKRIFYDALFIVLWSISAAALNLTAEGISTNNLPLTYPWIAVFLPLLPWRIVTYYERN